MATTARKSGPKSNVTAQFRGRQAQSGQSSTTRPAPSITTITRSSYSPDKLYTDSTDTKGHYEQINVKIPPQLEALIMQALDGNPDYGNSRQAFIRDAIVHRLHYIHTQPGSTIDPMSVSRHLMLAEMRRIQFIDEAIKEQARHFDQMVATCIENDDMVQLSALIDQLDTDLQDQEFTPGHYELLSGCLKNAVVAMQQTRITRPQQ